MAFSRPLAATLISSLFALGLSTNSSLPIVDLGYERHQAISFNENGGFYNFSNIRYGQAPVGNLRFRAPISPDERSNVVNNGSVGVMCPQATPLWMILGEAYLGSQLGNTTFDLAATEAAIDAIPPQTPDPKTTEDCLFLDVYAPRSVFGNSGDGYSSKEGAPVLIWITGGGFAFGDKTGVNGQPYNPEGLIKASQTATSKGLIFVSINYRLGAFGFLAGSEVEADGTPNAGLYDQRLALDWVQNNIYLFGGDKSRVTVMGESGGGASIIHQITAFEGKGPLPFSQAVIQSPGFLSRASDWQNEVTFETFLKHLNVSSLQEVRQLPSEALFEANIAQIAAGSFGDFSYGPTVDGVFTTDIPQRLLSSGAFNKTVKVMIGHNFWEAGLFQDPHVTNLTTFTNFVRALLPSITPGALSKITDVLYPPVFDGSHGYTTYGQAQALLNAEAGIICSTTSVSRAFGNQTYAYEFSVPSAIHGLDLGYTFATGTNPSINNNAATVLQQYITNFVINGIPTAKNGPEFLKYGPDNKIINIGLNISQSTDDAANERCEWWNKALYY